MAMRHRPHHPVNPCGGLVIRITTELGTQEPICGKCHERLLEWALEASCLAWVKNSDDMYCAWVLPVIEAEGLERVEY